MKNFFIGIGIIVLLGIIFVSWSNNQHSKAISYQENVDEAWSNVITNYQRRADLIPSLINTVKGAAENEKEILVKVTQARAGIVNAKSPEDLEMFGKEINTAINLAYEAYPQIRSTQNFIEFQAQLEGTENRIAVSRRNYNSSVKIYNRHIRGYFRKFAIGLYAEEGEFEKREMFQAVSENVETAPAVEF